MHPLPAPLPCDLLDRQLSPSLSSKDPMGVLTRHETQTAALDDAPDLQITRDLSYGSGARQVMDVCVPKGVKNAPCLIFIHGGFWQEGSKAGSGFAAPALAAAGWAHVSLGYTLAPQARLRDIVDEIAASVVLLQNRAAEFGIDPD